jgi:ABC-type branched-subunit amino acid transport system substrate-binding protein
MSRLRPRAAVVAGVLVGLALLLTACTPTTTSPRPTASASHTVAATGTLTVGTLFPVTGTASYLGPAQPDGVALAVQDVNAAGGVLGKPVTLVQGDSGDVSTSTIEATFAALQAKNADVVIGPSSSVLAERLFPKTVAARIPMISPAATSVRLSALSQSGYFARTIPSAAAQGTALGENIGGGKAKLAIIYLDDQTGQAIRASLAAAVAKGGGALVATEPYAAGVTNFATIIAAVVKAAPDDVVFSSNFGAMDQNKAVITALNAAGLGGAKLWLTSDDLADYSQALPVGALTAVNGVLEGVTPSADFTARLHALDPSLASYLYAAEAYDATVIAALAAAVAHDTSGSAIAAHLRNVTRGGIKCTNYAECLAVLKTDRDIDYDGLTGSIALDANGDPSPTHFGVYRYDGQNRFALVGSMIGS